MDDNITTDANQVESSSTILKLKSNKHYPITIQYVSEIEKLLDLIEKVSLVYLLYDDVEVALQYLIQLLNGALINVIAEWAQHAMKTSNWQEKLLEALTIIQNYQIISKLNYNKDEVCGRFLPMNSDTSLFIDLHKKKLYRISEKMTNAQMKTLLTHVKSDFASRKLLFKEFPLPYLEIYFLYWNSIKYISTTNYTNLSKIFKVMEMYNVADCLTLLHPSTRTKLNLTEDNIGNEATCVSMSSISTTSSIKQDRVWNNNYENKSYYIDPHFPGVCLIINQESFYTEPDPQWAHLLPSVDMQLDKRDGTNIDCDSLKSTFGLFGYTVIIKNNLTHEEVLETVAMAVNTVQKHSSLVICILSHGLEGRVYGVNSIPVNISEIRNIVCTLNTKNLKTKPKVLILQSCQGTECQSVSDDEVDEELTVNVEHRQRRITSVATPSHSRLQFDNQNIEMDGGSRPKTADVLLFWATVPGFGAVRDKTKGSWFIQSLCSNIQEKAHEMHFEDICTLVKQEVIDKRWKTHKMTRAMVPNKESTLSRFFFLPLINMPIDDL